MSENHKEKSPNQGHNKDRENWIFGEEIDKVMVIQGHLRRLIPWDEFMKKVKDGLNKKEEETPKEGENICHGLGQDDTKIC